jgi:three-Cys-motif partner protein
MLARSGDLFTYLDLFAGRGEFGDEAEGSPMLAFDIMEKHISQRVGPGNNRFSKVSIIAIDKNKEAATHLRTTLHRKLENCGANGARLEVRTGDEDWETYDDEISGLLSSSKWGFIFADPFSTELDIERLLKTVETHKAYKDILVLTNYRTQSRQFHRRQGKDTERVCKSLGISQDELTGASHFDELFGSALKRAFSLLKEFAIGVAIPVTVGGKLIKTDYFYLVLATDSIAVADSFLVAYERMIKTERGAGSWGTLFDEGRDVLEAFERNRARELTLREIMEDLWNNFLSWRLAVDGPGYQIPTIKSIIDTLNGLRGKRRVEFKNSKDFEYKTSRSRIVPGDLAYSKIRKGRDTKQIRVCLRQSL